MQYPTGFPETALHFPQLQMRMGKAKQNKIMLTAYLKSRRKKHTHTKFKSNWNGKCVEWITNMHVCDNIGLVHLQQF